MSQFNERNTTIVGDLIHQLWSCRHCWWRNCRSFYWREGLPVLCTHEQALSITINIRMYIGCTSHVAMLSKANSQYHINAICTKQKIILVNDFNSEIKSKSLVELKENWNLYN